MSQPESQPAIGRVEFIALMAMLFATIAFSIDAMLPAFPQIRAELTPNNPDRTGWIIFTFVLGMGIGTFFTGPLSDAFGRKSVMICGAALYILGATIAWASATFEIVLAARVLQGLGAAGPRVVSVAVIRDRYSGREMAKILSIVMMIFTLVPAIAPTLGYVIIESAGWRGIFVAFVVFSLTSVLWIWFRLPETHPPDKRRPLRLATLLDALVETLSHPIVRLSIMTQTLCMAMLFTLLMMVQPVYEQIYDKQDSFHLWFGFIALLSAPASFLNARFVVRLGMRRLIITALVIQIAFSSGVLIYTELHGTAAFLLFALWQAYVFFQAGLTIGNLNAIAMEPMGHIAGMAASIVGAVSTVVGVTIGSQISLLFDGTLRPLVGAMLVMAAGAFALMLYLGRIEDRLPAE